MATEGPNAPDTAAENSGRGTTLWTSATSAIASDNIYATTPMTMGNESRYLLMTDFDFVDMADDDEITHFTFFIECKANSAGANIKGIRLYSGGAFIGDFELWGASIPTSESVADVTKTKVEMDVNLTGLDVKDAGFGFGITVESVSAPTVTVSVDQGTLTLTYQAAGGPDPDDPANNPAFSAMNAVAGSGSRGRILRSQSRGIVLPY